ncbi:response regulator transcription factor [Acidihalobacter prosperus]|uniref:Transcriptional regulator n=1 Tax=Acidihalobacter prosperus TaxID=160660 RepID=A0A1A6C086_9GAMM|nr:response regulator [Acidihalobacter prosperus]OBS07970.1 transcriptional regulator [Acidihalobacter prosperus]
MKVMVVDDSTIIRSKIAGIARRGGLGEEIVVAGLAANGLEAVRLCKQTQPDIVTMDLTMPEMDGIECIESLVQIKPDVRILVVSALADKSTAIRALKKGAHGFICKPFTDEELGEALKELIAMEVRA